jgi:hypothetical protein
MKVYENYLIVAYVSLSGTEFVIRHMEDARRADYVNALNFLIRHELQEAFKKQYPIYFEYLQSVSENRPVSRFR